MRVASGINKSLTAFCRRCLEPAARGARVCGCGSAALVRCEELSALSVAHIDCDAFYASIEKRDNPPLTDKPVIVGGAARGVVLTCCYVARTYGVRSAMPMFQALKACPDAVVVKPNMRKYAEAGRRIRDMMLTLTPLVEPLSIDEAFLDLSGTARVHGLEPARALARLQNDIRREVGVTVSVGLSCNKFLAKIASDFDKPDGFSVIGRKEAKGFLAGQPVGLIWGVGPAFAEKLERDGFRLIGDLQKADPASLAKSYGEPGLRLARLCRGEDARKVTPAREAKTVSAETTFNRDISELSRLEDILWTLCEKVSRRMKKDALLGRTVTLKLKSPDFRLLTRRTTLERPSNLARALYAAARPMLREAHEGRAWRLIGVGYSDLAPVRAAPQTELFETPDLRLEKQEAAIDRIREKYGEAAIGSARALRGGED
jgi:DNA polymerase-4